MPVYKGAVFFDIDGTLIEVSRDIQTPPESACKAIKKLRENGFLVGIATGRAECYAPDFIKDFDCVVSCNGAIAKVNEEIVYNKTIPHSVASDMLSYMKANQLGFVIETTDGAFYYDELNRNKSWHNWVLRPFSEYPDINGELKINKICVECTSDSLDGIKRRYGNDIYIILHQYAAFADTGAAGVSKASGISAVLKYFSIDISDSYAFGNDNNDIEMLSFVGHGVAMTPHAPALDGLTEYVTDSVENDGIFNALKHYGLV